MNTTWNLRRTDTEFTAMNWVFDLAAKTRRKAGIDGDPTTEDLLRAVDESGVRLIHSDVPKPYCANTPNGAVIVLPLSWRGEDGDELLVHEYAHSLMSPGGGNLIRFLWPDSPRHERLATLWDQRDEQYADAFVAGWFRR